MGAAPSRSKKGEAMKHRMHYYNRVRGLSHLPCAKCLCGADMRGEREILDHEALIDGEPADA